MRKIDLAAAVAGGAEVCGKLVRLSMQIGKYPGTIDYKEWRKMKM